MRNKQMGNEFKNVAQDFLRMGVQAMQAGRTWLEQRSNDMTQQGNEFGGVGGPRAQQAQARPGASGYGGQGASAQDASSSMHGQNPQRDGQGGYGPGSQQFAGDLRRHGMDQSHGDAADQSRGADVWGREQSREQIAGAYGQGAHPQGYGESQGQRGQQAYDQSGVSGQNYGQPYAGSQQHAYGQPHMGQHGQHGGQPYGQQRAGQSYGQSGQQNSPYGQGSQYGQYGQGAQGGTAGNSQPGMTGAGYGERGGLNEPRVGNEAIGQGRIGGFGGFGPNNNAGFGGRGLGESYGSSSGYGQSSGSQRGLGESYGASAGYGQSGAGYGGGPSFAQGEGGGMQYSQGQYGAGLREHQSGGMQGLQSHRGRGPKNYTRSDERIIDDIHERLTHDDHIDASDIEVRCEQGRVILEGTVEQRWMKHHAEDLVERCSGVKDVDNRIRVQRSGSQFGSSLGGDGGSATAGSNTLSPADPSSGAASRGSSQGTGKPGGSSQH